MQIMAAAGLAQNFAALRALTTKGIQHGHMKMHLQNILNQFNATSKEKEIVTQYFEKRTVSHAAVVEKINNLRKPKVQWVDFLNFDAIQHKLSSMDVNKEPIFGRMNAQQMIEHLSAVTQIANGNWKVDVYVSDEKTARRKPFLNTENELQTGFKASFLADETNALKFESMHLAIEDLIHQLELFVKVFTSDQNRTIVHPFFGELDFEGWKKFQVKHFTHHFKQFDLLQ
jgi:hydroxymethylglutaryl-CoA reductase